MSDIATHSDYLVELGVRAAEALDAEHDRNELIRAAARAGVPFRAIGRAVGMSGYGVTKIVRRLDAADQAG